MVTRTSKVSNQVVTNIYGDIEDLDIAICIIISDENPTPVSLELLNKLRRGRSIEVWLLNQLLYDILEHEFVPQYDILSTSEKKKLLKTYGVRGDQLPEMKSDDPIARYFGVSKGTVFKITDKSISQEGDTISYRIVT